MGRGFRWSERIVFAWSLFALAVALAALAAPSKAPQDYFLVSVEQGVDQSQRNVRMGYER